MHSFVETLLDSAAAPVTVHFPPHPPMTLAALIGEAEEFADLMRDLPTKEVGLVLSSDSSSLACALGVLIAGKTLVSLAPRGHLAVDWEPLLPQVAPCTTECVQIFGRTARSDIPADFIQHTSGSTGDPKGVCLSMSGIESAVAATLSRLAPDGEQRIVSWLPMSHDMGFVGMFLMPLAYWGMSGEGGSLTIMSPDQFIRRPIDWFRHCSEAEATITSSSPSGLRALLGWLHARRTRGIRLDHLERLIVGAELIDPHELRRIHDLLPSLGSHGGVLTPAYGCAEAVLTVSLNSDQDAIQRSIEVAGCSFTSTGTTVTSSSVRIEPFDTSGPGEIILSGASLMTGYVGEERVVSEFRTGDVGIRGSSGDLIPLGRTEQWYWRAGECLPLVGFERAASQLGSIRGARVSSVQLQPGSAPVVAYESKRGVELDSELVDLHKASVGVRPDAVVRFERGTFPVTHSGKVAHAELRQALITLVE